MLIVQVFCRGHGQIFWQLPWVQEEAWQCFKACDIGHKYRQDSWGTKIHDSFTNWARVGLQWWAGGSFCVYIRSDHHSSHDIFPDIFLSMNFHKLCLHQIIILAMNFVFSSIIFFCWYFYLLFHWIYFYYGKPYISKTFEQ